MPDCPEKAVRLIDKNLLWMFSPLAQAGGLFLPVQCALTELKEKSPQEETT